MARNDLQGSLDLLVLKILSQMGEVHGYGIVLHIQRASDELLSRRGHSIPLCTVWNRVDGSGPSGRSQTRIGRRSMTV
jgi:hypothetical protein